MATYGGSSQLKYGYVNVTPQGRPVSSAYVNRQANTPAYSPRPAGQVLGATTSGQRSVAPVPTPVPTPSAPEASLDQNAARDSLYSEIDSLFGESSSLLNQQEQGVRAGEQDLYNSFTAPYDAQRPLLDQAKQEGLQVNAQQVEGNRQQEQNALSAARRLYQELTQGTQQRFGGGNSTSEFANAFFGREYQRNMGQVQNTAGENAGKLGQQAESIVKNYQVKVQELEGQKQGALAQARLAFQSKLDAINNARLGLSQNKAQLKLDALRELRANIQNIQSNALQLEQQFRAQVAQAQGQLASNVQAFKAQAGQQVDMNAIPNAIYSQFGGGQRQPGQQITGQYSPTGQADDFLKRIYGQN